MRIDQIVKTLHDELEDWARSRQMRVSMARDPFDVLEVLAIGPRDAVIIVADAGDEPVDPDLGDVDREDGVVGPVNQLLEVTVGQGLGLDVVKDWRLIAGRGNRKSVLRHVNEVRAFVLSLVYPDNDETTRRLSYRGREPVVTPEGVPLAAYKLRFGLIASVDVDADHDADELEE